MKFKLFEQNLSVVCHGLVERIGDDDVRSTNFLLDLGQDAEYSRRTTEVFQDHLAALKGVERCLKSDLGVHADDVVAVGHRVVMGGDRDSAAVIDDCVKREIERGSTIAPLHNPANLLGVNAATAAFPGAIQVAVFDTAFHTTMPEHNKTYALPKKITEKYRIRRYGFHGTSYKFILGEAAQRLGKAVEDCNLILMHLGAGASMCAVKSGRSIDTTMGLTPTAGLVMATRCGDVDPSIVAFVADKEGITADEVELVLNSQSGLFGLCGKKDMRDVHEAARRGDRDAKLAIDVFIARIRSYLGSYLFQLGGCHNVDAIVMSGGIGEHDADVRRRVLEGAEWAGICLDPSKNEANAVRIDTGQGSTQLLVIPTDEELAIAKEVSQILRSPRETFLAQLAGSRENPCV